MNWKRVATVIAVIVLAGLIAIKTCARLPSLANRTVSHAIAGTETTTLGKFIAPVIATHVPQSGVYPLRDGRDAFAARIRMTEAAERSLDVQYYIWHRDMSGVMLLDALRAAADRGVRVRLLLDDNNTSGLDDELAALDSHPNIEVRLFNPFVMRRARVLSFLTDFSRLNRRMHNKSFTADNQVTIVGGRNVGDQYFGAANDYLFADLDLLAVGPVVQEVSSQFDRYWSSDVVYPVDRIIAPARRDALGVLAANAARVKADRAAVAYMEALRKSSFVRQIEDATLPMQWVAARMISDDPGKAFGRARSNDLVIEQLKSIFGEPKSTLDLVSPYFVPGSTGTELFRTWASRSVRIRVLTNSYEATDVVPVHAGYAKRRAPLLRAGVTLYELRATSLDPERGKGSSTGSLHAKTFGVDNHRVFVGSFNFDPRSARLNTEMGFVVESPVLAHLLQESFDTEIPNNAYEVRLVNGDLVWLDRRGGAIIQNKKEPGTTIWSRSGVWLLSHLPIEGLL